MLDWNELGSEILKDLNSPDQESGIVGFIEKIRYYAVYKDQPLVLDKVMGFEDFFVKLRIESNEKQTKNSVFFQKVI